MTDVRILESVQQYIYGHSLLDVEKGKKIIAVVGDSSFAETFVDLMFQTYQMADDVITIEWFCSNEAKAAYLQPRAFLKEFISINGSLAPSKKETYGNLFFIDIHLYEGADKEKYALTFDVREGSELSVPELLPGEVGELERMAFNTHRVWEGEGNIDHDKLKERFKEGYNKTSSQSFALSIPGKLRVAGIEEENKEIAAEKFNEIVSAAHENPLSDEAVIIATISMLEHRRWILEKVCDGAGPYPSVNGKVDYSVCVNQRSVKKFSKAGKLINHPCIVRSTAKTPLFSGSYKNHIKWDVPSGEDNSLDELDRMSIELHRAMQSAANELRRNRTALNSAIRNLETGLDIMPESLKLGFLRFKMCIENIMDVSAPYTAQFETFEKDFIKAVAESDISNKQEIAELISEIRYILYPVLESNLYVDYKDKDTKLVESIPFILTGKRSVRLSVALGPCGVKNSDNDDYFPCVASATVLFADVINYLFNLEETTEIRNFKFKIRAINRYFVARGKKVSLRICAFYSENVKEKAELLKDALKSLREDKQITDYTLSFVPSDTEMINQAVMAARDASASYYDGTLPLFESSLLNAGFITKLSAEMPYFEFNSTEKCFVNTVGCEQLKYISCTQFLQVEDIFALMNAQDKVMKYLDYADTYMDYFNIYSGADFGGEFYRCTYVWSKLCDILKKLDGPSPLYVTGTFKVSGKGKESNKAFEVREDNRLNIEYANKMLRAMKEKGILTEYSIDDSTKDNADYKGPVISAKLRSKEKRNMFTKSGDVLETYVFFKACEEYWFDDVQTGYQFNWEKDKVVNELDCVVTKGFKSILAECKSVNKPDEDYYLILDSLGDHFGINYKKVLIMACDMRDPDGKLERKQYLSRSNQMDIITVWKKDEILNIGQTFKKIMNGEYLIEE